MNKFKSLVLIAISFVLFPIFTNIGNALPNKEHYEKWLKEEGEKIQRTSVGFFDNQKNTVSNIEFFTSNYGIFGYDIARNLGSGYWPRGSRNQYIFGGGMWFGAQKKDIFLGEPRTRFFCNVSYDPSLAASWMTPGRIEEGVPDKQNLTKYRVYFSTNFNPKTGEAYEKKDGPNWPIWDTGLDPYTPSYDSSNDSLKFGRYFGRYINDVDRRNSVNWPKGPAMISGEDIFSTFNDADLTRYQGGPALRRSQGYPLNIQMEQMIYSWGFGDYKNFIFVKFDIINASTDTLWNCWMAPIMDVDLSRAPALAIGAANDRVRYYDTDDTLNMAFQWTDPQFGEGGFGFGYLGFDWLESPATIRHFGNTWVYDTTIVGGDIKIDSSQLFREIKKVDSDFVRKDSAFYVNSSQLGLRTFRNWSSADDIREDFARYQFISQGGNQLGVSEAGDKRFMMSTGPFNVRPKDTSRVVVGIIIANTSKGGDADGTDADVKGLVELDKFAQSVYDNNFQAPIPPDPVVVQQKRGYNNSTMIVWDNNSENSVDNLEDGLDFMGYRIYRARRLDQDTISENSGNRVGPLAWEQIRQFELPHPSEKSVRKVRTGANQFNISIDSLRVVGNWIDPQTGIVDTMAIAVMRVGQGVILLPESSVAPGTPYVPHIVQLDSSQKPWGEYYRRLAPNERSAYPLRPDLRKDDSLFKNVLVGRLELNRSLIGYNPLFFRPAVRTITDAEFAAIPTSGVIYKKLNRIVPVKPDSVDEQGATVINTRTGLPYKSYLDSLDNNGNIVTEIIIIESSIADTVYKRSTYRRVPMPDGSILGYIDVLYPRPIASQMRDTNHVRLVLDSVYSFVQQGIATLRFPQFEETDDVRFNVIMPYMNRITRNRTFIDIGDDNRDGLIEFSPDITKTEKLINNVDYHYRVLSYDEGDVNKRTEPKLNNAQVGLPNFATVVPKAAPAGSDLKIELVDADLAKLGGIHNIQINSLNDDRVLQNFQGDTLEMSFEPYWFAFPIEDDSTRLNTTVGFYGRRITLTNLRNNQLLFDAFSTLEKELCRARAQNLLTENTFSLTSLGREIKDSVRGLSNDLGLENSMQRLSYFGNFTTGDFKDRKYCYASALIDPAYGTIEIAFDYGFEQFGGIFRPLEDITKPADVDVNVKAITNKINPPTQIVSDAANDYGTVRTATYLSEINPNGLLQNFNFVSTSFNNGPGEYEIEFLPGGTEVINLTYNKIRGPIKLTTEVPYLNLKVINKLSYKYRNRFNEVVLVQNNNEMPHYTFPLLPTRTYVNLGNGQNVTLLGRAYPDPRNIASTGGDANEYLGKYNIASYAWVKSRTVVNGFSAPNLIGRSSNDPYIESTDLSYSGLQGRYYLSNNTDTVDFNHIINLGGAQFALDFTNKGRTNSPSILWEPMRDSNVAGNPIIVVNSNSRDFKVGDKLTLRTWGGAAGLPLPGAKAKFVVKGGVPGDGNYTEQMLDKVAVVPNPYYISHEGQISPYDAKLYFTKLPSQCTIEIFTVAGDLIQTLNFEANSGGLNDEIGLDVWDLLTKNGLRVQSQTLLAVIKTPNGETTVQPFSVVVGPFRIVE